MSKTLIVSTDNTRGRKSSVQRAAIPAQLIPKIFHFIWLGKKPLPPASRRHIDLWQSMHPDWTVTLWTDDLIKERLGTLRYQARFDKATIFAQKSDIVRYEIMYRIGGVYADVDFEPLKPIDPLLPGLRAFVAFESPEWICNSIFGAVPRHPLFDRIFDHLEANWKRYEKGTVNQQTGPHYVTKMVREMGLTIDDGVRVFAHHVLFPYTWEEGDLGPPYDEASFAVHHWDKITGWNVNQPPPVED
jgi:mannosyltransferase OCH1-like enzyme